MKRLFYSMLMVLGTMAFAACSDDNNDNSQDGTITVVIEEDVDQAIYIQTFKEGDVVTIDWGDGTVADYASEPEKFGGEIGYYIIESHSYTDGKNEHTIIVQGNGSIYAFDCSYNSVTSLDVSKCPNLKELDCSNAGLPSLDVSKCTELTFLDCYGNSLTSLDVSKNTALATLWCDENQLTSLDVSKNTALTYLDCGDNQFTASEMNKIYEALPTVESGKLYCDQLGNPEIAEHKGWTVSFD